MSNQVEEKKVFKAPEFNVYQWIDANGKKQTQLNCQILKDNLKLCIVFRAGVQVAIVKDYQI